MQIPFWGFFIFILLMSVAFVIMYYFENYFPQLRAPPERRPRFDSDFFFKKSEEDPNLRREAVCRRIMEYLFDCPFPKGRHDFLINDATGRSLELDGFCASENIGFEHNGPQHYNASAFNQGNTALANAMYRDEIKKNSGFDLISIPFTVLEERIPDYIWNQLTAKRRQAIFEKNPSIF